MALATILGLGVNTISPNQVDVIGDYRDLHTGDGPIIPPEAAEGDPPFIDVNVALLEHSSGKALFVDARDVEEFDCGTIPGSVNVPFDYLPEDNLETYIDSAFGGVPRDKLIVTFCSGDECDLSLHLARNLQDLGYTNSAIFFGGAREWETVGLEMERRTECGE